MEPRLQLRDPSIRDQPNLTSQFINITNSTSLDESSRSRIRVEVMRDYHRRRILNSNVKEPSTLVTTSASTGSKQAVKEQIQKFRVGGGEGFRPWVPVKQKKRQTAKREPRQKVMLRIEGEADTAHSSQNGSKTRQDLKTVRSTPDLLTRWSPRDMGNNRGLNFDEDFATNIIDDGTFSLEFALRNSILHDSPASGMLDPFSAFALAITPRIQLLLHFYFNVRLDPSWLMMPMRKGLFSLAVHDPAMFHTFLTHYITTYNASFQISDSSEVLYHSTMAIQLVNKRLSGNCQFPKDETIATVANLVNVECSNGSVDSALVHLNGLEQLVNLRGGLIAGGFSPHIQRLIAWADFHCSSALLQKPRFPPLAFASTNNPANGAPSLEQSYDNGQCTLDDSQQETISSLLASIRDLSVKLDLLRQQPMVEDRDIWYSDRLYHLQRHFSEVLYSVSNERSGLDLACATAALIYCAHCFRDVPFAYKSMVAAVARLKDLMLAAETTLWIEVGEEYMGLFIWALTIGSLASEGKSERRWFVEKFQMTCVSFGLNDWETTREILVRYAWQQDLDDGGRQLWSEGAA